MLVLFIQRLPICNSVRRLFCCAGHRTGVPPSRRIEDRIQNLVQKLIQANENTDEFNTLSAELRFAVFTLEWQISQGLKDFPAELERRSSR